MKTLDFSAGSHAANTPAALKTFIFAKLNRIINKSPTMVPTEINLHPLVFFDFDFLSRQFTNSTFP